jgi:large subunit ribosomal protein L30
VSLKVVQVRSGIGTRPKHRGTLRALGLGRIGKSRVLPDRPEIRGMIARVPHLITVETVDDEVTSRTRQAQGEPGTAAAAAPPPTTHDDARDIPDNAAATEESGS